jgi:hypothetical protein
MPYPLFDRTRLRLQPLAVRTHDLTVSSFRTLDEPATFAHPHLPALGERLATAKQAGAA